MTRTPIAILLTFAAFGCSITETGNPEFAGQVSLLLDSSAPEEVSIGPGGNVVIDSAWVGFGDVRLVRDPGCDEIDEMEVDLAVTPTIDLAAGAEIVPVDVELDELCRVRVPMARVAAPLPMGAPSELQDAAIALSGALGDGTPFLVVSRQEREADVRSRTVPFAIEDGRRAVLMSFDVAVWLAGVDLSSGAMVGGRILVDDENNTSLLDAFEANVESALRLYRDGDEDGELDPDDRSEVLASGGP